MRIDQPDPRRLASGLAVLLISAAVCIAAMTAWWRVEHPAETAGEFTVFARRGCPIFTAAEPTPEETRAARLIQLTLARAAGRATGAFPIRRQDAAREHSRGIFVGGPAAASGGSPLQEEAAYSVSTTGVQIRSAPAAAIEAAVAWFLEESVDARWFVPGPLGEEVSKRAALRLPFGEHSRVPSFASRNLGLSGSAAEREWYGRNRLRSELRHYHAMNELFPSEAVQATLEFAPLVNGRRELPVVGSGNWQPNIAAPGAAEHTAKVLAQRHEASSAIGMNDSIRYDQSAATLQRVGGPRWFRDKPDYSDLVFGFVNDVAGRLPGRLLGAYAYDWTEDVPRFPVEPNVVPWLTADRSQWFDPAFAAEDKDLIKRWVAAGPEAVALHDYYYGVPFFVPRPTLYAVAQSIPFAHRSGVRGFYAETYSNWGLDGPKAWLAAQLLWDAERDPAELLDIYYREFWQAAAGPMRRFFELCDRQWLEQPLPSYWIKYYKDEHQHLLFPKVVREKLAGCLQEALAAGKTPMARARAQFAGSAWAVTEAFCDWCEARDLLSRQALATAVDAAAVKTAWRRFVECRKLFDEAYADAKARHPLAVNSTLLGEYTRNDPRPRAAFRLAREAKEPVNGLDFTGLDRLPAAAALARSGTEVLADASLKELRIKPPQGFTDLEWVSSGEWRGHGEPYRTRRISLEPSGGGQAIRLSGCKQDTLSQWRSAVPGALYVARAKVRGKVSLGNMTFLILNFGTGSMNSPGIGSVDRLPVGDYPDGVELITWAVAPPNAGRVGLGVRVLNQVNDDSAVFYGFSLQRVE